MENWDVWDALAYFAVKDDNATAVKNIIHDGVDINHVYKNGVTLAHCAAEHNNVKCLRV